MRNVYAMLLVLITTNTTPKFFFNDITNLLDLSKYTICESVEQKKEVKKEVKSKPVAKSSIIEKFVKEFYPVCKKLSDENNIPVDIILGQAALESYFGTSDLSRNRNNYFGIRKGKKYVSFSNKYDSFHGYVKVLKLPRYKKLYEYTEVEDWAKGIKAAGYAEDPDYVNKLLNIISNLRIFYG